MNDDKKPILSLRNISKSFPGVTALQDISIDFHEGEVHALLGENGAGKSTLIKSIAGYHAPDEGEIIVAGTSYREMNPRLAKQLGIEVIYQEFTLVPTLSAAENIYLWDSFGSGVLVNKKAMIEKARRLFQSLDVHLDPSRPVKHFSPAEQQIVEIAKAISKDVRILIMDEPTASLTPAEVKALFNIVRKLKAQGVAIIYISHRMQELFEISDRITVMRDGRYIATKRTGETYREELLQLMVGRELTEQYPVKRNAPGDVVLEAKNLYGNRFSDISFHVRAGEILGVFGLVGAGRTEVARSIFGADPLHSGELLIRNQKVNIRNPGDAIRLGIGLIPEDRKQQGVILRSSVLSNIVITSMKRLSRFMVVNKKAEVNEAETYVRELSIKTPFLSQLAGNLSGGNQQKIVLAKWLARTCSVLIFDEPTRGIDVGAKQDIYRLIASLAEQGVAVVMISSDMEELLGMSDRIMVLCEGKWRGELPKTEFSQQRLIELASN